MSRAKRLSPLQRDIIASNAALPSWCIRYANYTGITDSDLRKSGLPVAGDALDNAITKCAVALGFGKDKTAFLRALSGNRIADFNTYQKNYNDMLEKFGDSWDTYKYVQGVGVAISDMFQSSVRGMSVSPRWSAKRNAKRFGTKRYRTTRQIIIKEQKTPKLGRKKQATRKPGRKREDGTRKYVDMRGIRHGNAKRATDIAVIDGKRPNIEWGSIPKPRLRKPGSKRKRH